MDTLKLLDELAQASYEEAEAESYERRAKALRLKAKKRHASIFSEFKDAVADYREQKLNEKGQ